MTARDIATATGRLGVLTPGMGAVASTFIAGVISARKGLKPPIGSITQMAHIRLGTKGESRNPLIRDFAPLAELDDIVFGGWDPISSNALEAAETSGVLEGSDLNAISSELESIVPMEAVFDQRWVSKLDGVRVKKIDNKWDQAIALIDDIATFREENGCDRLVMVWCGSTEAYQEPSDVHETVAAFEQGLRDNDENISPSQIYAYAALQSDVPFANGAPNLSVDLPCMIELSQSRGVPIAGKDFKTGQTLMKTLLAPGFKARMLGMRGWYSTNILGNRDGEVLDDPENFKSKEVSKLDGVRVKKIDSKWDQAMALIDDIAGFKEENGCDRLVMVWCGSTEAYQEPSEVHQTVAAFEQGLRDNDENISPSQIYVYAALQSDVPFANGAPNLSVDLPCMIELSESRGVPIAGKDFKTGQTLMKTLLAPGFKARMLGMRGWYSTNILGNRDGEVLDLSLIHI